MLITQERISASLSRSDYRIAKARHRARKQKLTCGGIALILLLLLSLGVLMKLAVRNPPAAPRLTVVWPAAQLGLATLKSGTTLLTRTGQSLTVSVENSSQWRVSVHDGAGRLQSNRVLWTPTNDVETLVLECRPVLSGWRILGSFSAPRYQLTLRGLRVSRGDDGRLTLRAKSNTASALVSSRVQVNAGTSWDDRALPLLEAAANAYPSAQPLTAGEARWVLASSFDSQNAKPDGATYAALNDSQPTGQGNAEMLAKLARVIAQRAPKVSIKLVGGRANAQGITLSVARLAFDGSGARDGWLKAPGDTAGQKWRWWQGEAVAPVLARPTPTATPRPTTTPKPTTTSEPRVAHEPTSSPERAPRSRSTPIPRTTPALRHRRTPRSVSTPRPTRTPRPTAEPTRKPRRHRALPIPTPTEHPYLRRSHH